MRRPRDARAADAARAGPVFAALGDPTRLAIVSRLSINGPMSIARLTDGTSVSRQAVTKHLRALAAAGLLRSTRAGRERHWEVRTQRLAEVRGYLARISEQWDQALARLRIAVEGDG